MYFLRSGPVFCLLLGVSSDYAQSITGQVTEVTCPVIDQAQPELTPSRRQKTGPDFIDVVSTSIFICNRKHITPWSASYSSNTRKITFIQPSLASQCSRFSVRYIICIFGRFTKCSLAGIVNSWLFLTFTPEVEANFLRGLQTTLSNADMLSAARPNWAPTCIVVVQGWDGCESGSRRSVAVDQPDSQH